MKSACFHFRREVCVLAFSQSRVVRVADPVEFAAGWELAVKERIVSTTPQISSRSFEDGGILMATATNDIWSVSTGSGPKPGTRLSELTQVASLSPKRVTNTLESPSAGHGRRPHGSLIQRAGAISLPLIPGFSRRFQIRSQLSTQGTRLFPMPQDRGFRREEIDERANPRPCGMFFRLEDTRPGRGSPDCGR